MSAICEDPENDIMGRTEGEALWPERFSVEDLMATKEIQGKYYWEALYQQNPLPPGAGLIENGQLVAIDIIPHSARLKKVRWWDLAASGERGDWLVGGLSSIDKDSGLTYIEDIIRVQVEAAAAETIIKGTAVSDGKGIQIVIEQEPGASGKMLIDHYQRIVLKGWSVKGERPSGPKFVRAQPLFAAIQAGHVRILRAPWNKEYIEELKMFPEGDYDDQVDVTSGAFNYLWEGKPKGAVWGRDISGTLPSGVPLIIPKPGPITGATFGR